MIRILLVDDHPIFRRGLLDLLSDYPDVRVTGQAGSISEALAAVAAAPPDVAVVDLTLGHESGLDLLAHLSQVAPQVKAIMLSGHDERLYAQRALASGARGYLMKTEAATESIAAVRAVRHGKCYVSTETADRILSSLGMPNGAHDSRTPIERLSHREHHVFVLIGQGLSSRDIAGQLGLSVKTVESHIAHLKHKLGAENGRDLMRLAVSWTGAVAPATNPLPASLTPAEPGSSGPLRN